jgi:serine/threonine protein kinase
MSDGSADAIVSPRAETAAPEEAEGGATCPNCGSKIRPSRPAERCPVCQLRAALEVESGSAIGTPGPVAPIADKAAVALTANRYDHYELLTRDDGTPVELGRGAMGVTYKAFDANLRCPVALKVINARYLHDESARARFVREARAAARLRHPNVASVFHLGTKGGDYFYAMEFVEGETLEERIHRGGPLDLALSLEVIDQVAAALGAAHHEQIVHRDIKPANLMLRLSEKGAVNVKVIDFGLAKAASTSHSDPALSTPGTFAGTALFASPEQCAGGEVDIRSDIYSLGITLWEMLTAKVPFDGAAAHVMSQHLHAPLPLDQLDRVPPPVAVLLQFMLEKDPAQRPQSPSELQSALRAMKKALESSRSRLTLGFPANPQPRRGWLPRAQRWWLVSGAGIAVLACALAFGAFFFTPKARPRFVTAKSIAVLPFDNLSDSKENEYFTDGLTSEVIYQLSNVADLRVTARSSILRYKDMPTARRGALDEIGAALGVGAILESSVQRVGNRVKIVTMLYAVSGSQRLWGSSYDRELKDVFAIQSDIAEQIAVALQAKLSVDQRDRLQRRPTENLNAYDLYLQGRALRQSHGRADNDKAIELFKQAREEDPKFVLAYIGLADAYIDRVKRFQGEGFWLDSAIDLCQQAVALDPQQLRAYTELASAFNLKGWFDRMEAPVQTALKLAPNDWDVNRMAAAEFTELRREVEMYASIRKCYATNPYDSWAPYELALICWTVGENGLAERWMQRAIDLEPDSPRRRLMESERLVYRGDYAAALPGLQALPPELKTQYTAVSDLVLFCSLQTADWPTVTRLAQAKLKTDGEDPTALLRLALAFRGSGQATEARRAAERAVPLAQERLAASKSPRWMRFDLAIAFRFLDRKDEAYERLRDLLAKGGFPDPVLGSVDPALNLFRPDDAFAEMLANLHRQKEGKRAGILQVEKGF